MDGSSKNPEKKIEQENPKEERNELLSKYIVKGMKIECVYYFPKFLDNEFATKACEKFRKDFVWSENTKTNRAQVLYGDEGVDYKYHMMANKEIFKWDPLILEIKSKTEELYFKLTNKKVIFNVMLANYYKDGLSNIGWHADREEVETKKKKEFFFEK